MKNYEENNIKLGLFVLAGLLILFIAFYVTGRGHILFGSDFEVKARFTELSGLTEGNNVQFAGIHAGTIKRITIIDDTTIEVDMSIDKGIRAFIRKNALAAIGSEGLMGNRLVNILPGKGMSPPVSNGDLLRVKPPLNTDDMLQVLSTTNNNMAVISQKIRNAVSYLDNSELAKVINDRDLSMSLKATFQRLQGASASADDMMHGLNSLVYQVKAGKGAAGVLLSDTGFASNLWEVMNQLSLASGHVNELAEKLDTLAGGMNQGLFYGKGVLHMLLQDSVFAENLNMSMINAKKGTEGFSQNMEALRHNFLLRGYFRKTARREVAIKRDSINSPVIN